MVLFKPLRLEISGNLHFFVKTSGICLNQSQVAKRKRLRNGFRTHPQGVCDGGRVPRRSYHRRPLDCAIGLPLFSRRRLLLERKFQIFYPLVGHEGDAKSRMHVGHLRHWNGTV